MNKKTLTLIIFSFLVIVIWIGYTVYSNIVSVTYDSDNAQSQVDKYAKTINTDMSTDILKKINALSGNVKVSNSSLSGQ